MALLKKRARLSAGAESAADLEVALEQGLDALGTRDIALVLQPFNGTTWKTAAVASVPGLHKSSAFFAPLLRLCPRAASGSGAVCAVCSKPEVT